jgi:hypothetical protein
VLTIKGLLIFFFEMKATHKILYFVKTAMILGVKKLVNRFAGFSDFFVWLLVSSLLSVCWLVRYFLAALPSFHRWYFVVSCKWYIFFSVLLSSFGSLRLNFFLHFHTKETQQPPHIEPYQLIVVQF